MPMGSDRLSSRLCWELRSQSDSPRGSWVTLVDAHSGETVRLSALWKRSHVLMEFGSFT